HIKIATIFYEQAMYLEALDEFQLLLIKEEQSEPHVLMARIYELLGRLDRAIEEFEVLRELEPKSVDVLVYTARLYNLNDQPDRAVEL
ncbi:MAG: tetratricopeptide repeat protein, partial [Nitrospinaceae bacterium]|nr:tetratricopeptide repeat protein [Nitrospinaceae bacterium]NIR53288.1 tetratricopeptide repeat protein [Nitrospinaceae bacterium]NIS83686.1 tetratricopeptide repeat protein [Nitrospinaceae bacterium]NIT80488.1 tetratricopeptide repeat protein [Nitrospinaceae bacterium]NIU42816.1 tetratricopeptide repeat protein [Nitrospinaceae bacterium]